MQVQNKNIVITGAAGGIGSEISRQLAAQGATLVLLDRDGEALEQLAAEIEQAGGRSIAVAVDLLDEQARACLSERIAGQVSQVDVLINAAGIMSFSAFADEDPPVIERIMQLNTVVPMLLTRQFLAAMLDRGDGRIVNIGSTFGSIAFAWFAAYSASKFALRGFSEALRRELAGSGVTVSYIAPRAVKTPFNTEAVYKMAKLTGMNMDEPSWVAQQVMQSIRNDAKDVYLGFPEKLFVRINAILPRLVDKALYKQNRQVENFAREKH